MKLLQYLADLLCVNAQQRSQLTGVGIKLAVKIAVLYFAENLLDFSFRLLILMLWETLMVGITSFSALSFSGSCGLQVPRSSTLNILNKYSVEYHLENAPQKLSFHQRSSRTYLVNAASGHPLEPEPEPGAYDPNNQWNSVRQAADAFYRFSRPHTVIGTVKSREIFKFPGLFFF